MKTFFANIIYLLLVKPWLTLIIGVRYVNRNVFKGVDQCIIIANHNSHFDVVSIISTLPYRLRKKTCAVATIDYFGSSTLTKKLMSFFFNAILIHRNRKEGEMPALDILDQHIKAGRSLIIFPEGSRGEAGELAEFRKGVGVILSQNPGLPYIPVYLDGFGRVLPKKSFLILPMVSKVRFGEIQYPGSTRPAEIIEEIKASVLSLKGSFPRDRNKFFIEEESHELDKSKIAAGGNIA
jgi:1-acyl-sn-glycerol-3-phosphate acyltransferase